MAQPKDGLHKIESGYICKMHNMNRSVFPNGAKATIIFGDLEQIFSKTHKG